MNAAVGMAMITRASLLLTCWVGGLGLCGCGQPGGADMDPGIGYTRADLRVWGEPTALQGFRPAGAMVYHQGKFVAVATLGGSSGRGCLLGLGSDGGATIWREAMPGGTFASALAQDGGKILGLAGDAGGGWALYEVGYGGEGYRELGRTTVGKLGVGNPAGPLVVEGRVCGVVGDQFFSFPREGGEAVLRLLPLEEFGHPTGPMVARDGWIYGAGAAGEEGTPGSRGTIFRVRGDGSAAEVLYRFPSDGRSNPMGGLVAGSDGRFYGTAQGKRGEASARGGLFTWDPAVDEMAWLVDFSTLGVVHGCKPAGGLVFSPDGNTLFGATRGNVDAGGQQFGSVFAVMLREQLYFTLHVFGGGPADLVPLGVPLCVGSYFHGLASLGGTAAHDYRDGGIRMYTVRIPDRSFLGGAGVPLPPG
jgi:hypothetical protein